MSTELVNTFTLRIRFADCDYFPVWEIKSTYHNAMRQAAITYDTLPINEFELSLVRNYGKRGQSKQIYHRRKF